MVKFEKFCLNDDNTLNLSESSGNPRHVWVKSVKCVLLSDFLSYTINYGYMKMKKKNSLAVHNYYTDYTSHQNRQILAGFLQIKDSRGEKIGRLEASLKDKLSASLKQ